MLFDKSIIESWKNYLPFYFHLVLISARLVLYILSMNTVIHEYTFSVFTDLSASIVSLTLLSLKT
jgi:hypothetical protein